ncbi:MAG: adenosylcobinamide-GDP ribazoletransferase [Cyanothece sp. SIO2G6]|nr:adenosylcobinamide-GDP ribazoletransferase [Cyanothece sp. SIO2G6]
MAAIAFYTSLPVPPHWSLDFRYVSRMAPVVGLVLGGILVALDWGLMVVGMPILPRSALVVATWLALTGGLHMDGAMDTADGLAVMNPERRLAVMADSATGAFGAMVAVVILGLKWASLSSLDNTLVTRMVGLLLTPMWGRWGQQVAIAAYPYLKPTGKGAFHKAAFPSLWLVVGSGISCALLSLGIWMMVNPAIAPGDFWRIGGRVGGAIAIAVATGIWFKAKLGGHTGDTYGAVVEWTEAGLLMLLTTC